MDTVKLEARWPPDGKHRLATDFGIYKEPDGEKRPGGTEDRAAGFLLVVSLISAVAVVLYFTFSDYTIPTTQAALTGPAISYARYAKDKQSTTAATTDSAAARTTDRLLSAVLGAQNAENYTTACCPIVGDDVAAVADRTDDSGRSEHGRRMRPYPIAFRTQPPAGHAHSGSGSPDNRKTAMDSELKYESDSVYEFGRRSEFPQLASYQAPFAPKSILDVMRYVTSAGPPRREADAGEDEFMTAQESRTRYVPARTAEEVNRLQPDAVVPTSDPTRRFRNKFGPPDERRPEEPAMALPDDFMKPPDPDAHYSMNFEETVMPAADLAVQANPANFPSHTNVVFHSPPPHTDVVNRPTTADGVLPAPDVTTPKTKIKKHRRKKNQKPISVMLDIYPLDSDEDEDDDDEGGNHDQDDQKDFAAHDTPANQQSERDKLLLRLNLFPNFSNAGRRISKFLRQETLQEQQMPLIHLTTHLHDGVEHYDEADENGKSVNYEYTSEPNNAANISKTQ